MTGTAPKGESKRQRQQPDDPVLLMLAAGKQLWKRESGDRFIECLRSEGLPPSPFKGQPEAPAENATESNIGADSEQGSFDCVRPPSRTHSAQDDKSNNKQPAAGAAKAAPIRES